MNKLELVPIIKTELCLNCDKCVAACPTNAIYKKVDVSCAKCIKYCIAMKVPCNPEHYIFCYEQCDACGKCVSVCPVDAVYWFKIPK